MQETYNRREELRFRPDVAKYFLDQVIGISRNQYEPSEKDILLAKGITPSNGLDSIEFSFNDSSESAKCVLKYQLIQLTSKGLCNSCKWLDRFEDTSSIIFCASLIDYDQTWTDTRTCLVQNKMLSVRDFFKRLATNPCLHDKQFVLFLNKYDLLEDKINDVPITVCEWFAGFNPVKISSKNPCLAQQAYYYIAKKFNEVYVSITGRKLYVCQTRAYERSSVDEAFGYLCEIIKWEEEKSGDKIFFY